MVKRATSENMTLNVRSADGDTAEIEVENHDSDSEYTLQIEGNIPVECSCPSFEYHCSELDDGRKEACKHQLRYAVEAP